MGFFSKISRFVDDVLLLPDEARELAEKARKHLDLGEAAEALEVASTALKIRDDHPLLLSLAAEALARLDEPAEAERMFREALDLDEDHAPARVELARLLRRSGRLEEAAKELRRAVPVLVGAEEKAAAGEALRELALCYEAMERPDRAARELRKAVTLVTDDPRAHLALARVLLDDRGRQEASARAAARRAAALIEDEVDGALIREAGEVAYRAGLDELAAGMLGRAQELGEAVHLLLGKVALRRGEAMAAHEHALRAMAEAPGSAEPHRLRAELAARAGDRQGALTALQAAISLEPGDQATLERALETAAQVDLATAGELAKKLLERDPRSPLGQAVQLRAAVASGDDLRRLDAELEGLEREAPDQVEVWLARAELSLALGDGEAALGALERVEAATAGRGELEPLSAAACRLVASAGSGLEPDLFDVLERVHALLVSRPDLSELGVEVGRIREDYDKPLLLTVMGEFNAGKSTFINALVGEPVAPMGITPTTATINVLKYGPRKMARVFHRSGTVKELEYEALGGWLKGLSREAAVEVRKVEILYPAEELTRVNLVDTPGFNSIVAEHEKVAREFIERADAVVWLFDAGQPGKESERGALERVREQGKSVLGVLNKADRLEPAALARVLEHLEGEDLKALVAEFVPLSARLALTAKQGEVVDEVALARSGLPGLQSRLEAVFYSRARLIKRAGCAARLVTLLEQAIARETAANAALRRGAATIDDARAALEALPESLTTAADDLVRDGLTELRRGVAQEAAREVLEFVRPRRHLLEGHRFSPEDRRYLVELIEGRLAAAMEGLASQLSSLAVSATEGLWGELQGLDGAEHAVEGGRRDGEEFGRTVAWAVLAFQRGLVRGGRADRFFDDTLPRLELESSEIARRIERWWRGAEGEVHREIEHGVDELSRRLEQRLEGEARRLRVELARRRRAGALPLSGFASLSREWASGR